MLLPASQEYIALCQAQVSLLLQGIRAAEVAIYMTEQFETNAALKPLVLYPDDRNIWPNSVRWQLEGQERAFGRPLLLEGSPELLEGDSIVEPETPIIPETPEQNSAPQSWMNEPAPERHQIVRPLTHESAVLGVLMVARSGQSWSSGEQAQVEQVANTLSVACILDQRSQWLSRSGYEKQALLSDEHQRLSKLLHQFRNPLTALRTLGKLMLRRMTQQDPNRNFAQSIVQQSDRLEMMLQEFSQTLDVGEETIETLDQSWTLKPSKAPPALLPAAGVISGASLSLQPCWLADILDSVLSAVIGRMEERQIELFQAFPENLPSVNGDTQALTEILSNLVDNAIKYTHDAGAITIQLQRHGGSHQNTQVVSISDTGAGIPVADLERIFEGRYRGIQANSDIQGTGLGLAIVYDLVQKMNGTIQAFSPALTPPDAKVGSTFRLTLPEYRSN